MDKRLEKNRIRSIVSFVMIFIISVFMLYLMIPVIYFPLVIVWFLFLLPAFLGASISYFNDPYNDRDEQIYIDVPLVISVISFCLSLLCFIWFVPIALLIAIIWLSMSLIGSLAVKKFGNNYCINLIKYILKLYHMILYLKYHNERIYNL